MSSEENSYSCSGMLFSPMSSKTQFADGKVASSNAMRVASTRVETTVKSSGGFYSVYLLVEEYNLAKILLQLLTVY